jgi:hypothetical protein
MTDQHPITPPPELVQKWLEDSAEDGAFGISHYIATQAARWGSDQELDACCKWLPKLPPWSADDLRRHRRPKPPSLKEQALERCNDYIDPDGIIRRAINQLPDE